MQEYGLRAARYGKSFAVNDERGARSADIEDGQFLVVGIIVGVAGELLARRDTGDRACVGAESGELGNACAAEGPRCRGFDREGRDAAVAVGRVGPVGRKLEAYARCGVAQRAGFQFLPRAGVVYEEAERFAVGQSVCSRRAEYFDDHIVFAVPLEALADAADADDLSGGVFHSYFIAVIDGCAVDDEVVRVGYRECDEVGAAARRSVHRKMAAGSVRRLRVEARGGVPAVVARLGLDQRPGITESLGRLEEKTVGIIFEVFIGKRRIDENGVGFGRMVIQSQHQPVADAAGGAVAPHCEHIAAVIIEVVGCGSRPETGHILDMVGSAGSHCGPQRHQPFDIFVQPEPEIVFPEDQGPAFCGHQHRIAHIFLVLEDGIVVGFGFEFQAAVAEGDLAALFIIAYEAGAVGIVGVEPGHHVVAAKRGAPHQSGAAERLEEVLPAAAVVEDSLQDTPERKVEHRHIRVLGAGIGRGLYQVVVTGDRSGVKIEKFAEGERLRAVIVLDNKLGQVIRFDVFDGIEADFVETDVFQEAAPPD